MLLAPWKKIDEQECAFLESTVWKGRQEPFMFLIVQFISFDYVYALINHDNYSHF